LLEGRPVIFLLEMLAARRVRGLFEPISVGEISSSVVVICSGSSDIVTAVELNQIVLQCQNCVSTNDEKRKGI
jgi:hypothetical protein